MVILYKDLISNSEMFSDIYKIQEIAVGLFLEVEGKMVSGTEGSLDDSLVKMPPLKAHRVKSQSSLMLMLS